MAVIFMLDVWCSFRTNMNAKGRKPELPGRPKWRKDLIANPHQTQLGHHNDWLFRLRALLVAEWWAQFCLIIRSHK